MTPQWYVLRTRPRSESNVAAALEREGFDVFFPQIRIPYRDTTYAYKPMFPGYVFVHFDMKLQDAEQVYRQPGILGWVHFGSVTPSVPEKVIAELGEQVDRINNSGGSWRRFRPGETVRVVSGALVGLGQVVKGARSPRDRVQLLLEFMGRSVTTHVPGRDLEPAPPVSQIEAAPRARRTRGRGRWIRGLGPAPTLEAVAGGNENKGRPAS